MKKYICDDLLGVKCHPRDASHPKTTTYFEARIIDVDTVMSMSIGYTGRGSAFVIRLGRICTFLVQYLQLLLKIKLNDST